MTARLDVGAYVVLAAGVTVTEGLAEALCRVVRVEGELRDIRRVGLVSGEPEGAEVRLLASELRPVGPSVLRWHEALRLRLAVARWRQAVAADDEDVDTLALLVESAEELADLVIDAGPTGLNELPLCGYVSELDDAQVVEIVATEGTGRVRVYINEGVIYDGDPGSDNPPGAYYDGPGWVGGEAERYDKCDECVECGAFTRELDSIEHGPECSLNPANEQAMQGATGLGSLADVAARVDPMKAQYAVARACAALGRDFDWDAGMFNKIREAIEPAAPLDCPAVSDQSAGAIAFWRNVIER